MTHYLLGDVAYPESTLISAGVERRSPVVVIDPEDREQAQRLADALVDVMCKADGGWDKALAYEVRSHMATALREFANPTPPRPDEPQGLGAVVEDEQGRLWVRDGDSPMHDNWRRCGENDWHGWDYIDVPTVLSHGYTKDGA